MKPEAEDLVQAGRQALRPSAADRERVFRALLPHVGGALGAATTSTASAAPAAAKGILAKIATVAVGLGVAGGGVFLALRPDPAPVEPAATAPVTTAETPRAPLAVPEPAPSAAPEARPAEKTAPTVSSRPADSLAEEVTILSRASAELHAGRPAAALKALDEHRRRFPRAVLAQERTSARIQALCALGRMKEAQAELRRLARSSPGSPHVARARKACGSGLAQE